MRVISELASDRHRLTGRSILQPMQVDPHRLIAHDVKRMIYLFDAS